MEDNETREFIVPADIERVAEKEIKKINKSRLSASQKTKKSWEVIDKYMIEIKGVSLDEWIKRGEQ